MTQYANFPTEEHAEAAHIVADYASTLENVDTILVVNSCARGKATEASDLDMAILLTPPIDENHMELMWLEHANANLKVQEFCERSPFSAIHLDFFDGTFEPAIWDDGGGPDDFEIEIGNRVCYPVPLLTAGSRFPGRRRCHPPRPRRRPSGWRSSRRAPGWASPRP